MKVGQIQKLKVARISDYGLYLVDEEQNEVLLPNRYVSLSDHEGDEKEVFVYHDSEDRLVATTETPTIKEGEVAYLKVVDKSVHGAFLDWGLTGKDLFLPNRNQPSHTEMQDLKEERKTIEKSWEEQRNYVKKAEVLLGVEPDYPITIPNTKDYVAIELPKDIDFEISWQIFDNSDYQRYQNDYMRSHVNWAIWDFTKVGLPNYNGGIYTARVSEAYKNGERYLYKLEFETEIAEKYGLPYFYVEQKQTSLKIQWFDKKASRFPQACWFKLKGLEENWKIQKMGRWISPEEIIGSPFIVGLDAGVKNSTTTIKSLDCALVAPFGRRLLKYDFDSHPQDMYFNLYNNIWNTNFPMWYTDDAMFRFEITPCESYCDNKEEKVTI